jgi:hypothetical protein
VKSAFPAIPRGLQAKVASLARRLRRTPRLVNIDAIDEYVARHDPEAVTQAMNRIAELMRMDSELGVAGAARRILKQTEW